MSDLTKSNIRAIYEFPKDPPEKEAVIQSLLWALQEVRLNRISSVAVIGVSEDLSHNLVIGEGVRFDHIPYVIGLADMLQDSLRQDYSETLASFEDALD